LLLDIMVDAPDSGETTIEINSDYLKKVTT